MVSEKGDISNETNFGPKDGNFEAVLQQIEYQIVESTLKSPLSGFKPDNIRLAHNPSC